MSHGIQGYTPVLNNDTEDEDYFRKPIKCTFSQNVISVPHLPRQTFMISGHEWRRGNQGLTLPNIMGSPSKQWTKSTGGTLLHTYRKILQISQMRVFQLQLPRSNKKRQKQVSKDSFNVEFLPLASKRKMRPKSPKRSQNLLPKTHITDPT